MSDPLRPIRYLPWRELFQTAILTALIVLVLELVLFVLEQQFAPFANLLQSLFSSTLGSLIPILTGFGTGILAVILLERSGRVRINASTLWALVACIFLIFLPRSLISLPPILFSISQTHMICMIVGVFWQSRSYWRW